MTAPQGRFKHRDNCIASFWLAYGVSLYSPHRWEPLFYCAFLLVLTYALDAIIDVVFPARATPTESGKE